MTTFDLTTHILDRHKADFYYYYMTSNPANNNDNVICVNFGG